MGAKCCMPVRDDMPMILRKKYRLPHELYTRRNNRCSPSWSLRCDNRTYIEDIVDNPAWLSHGHGSIVVSERTRAGDTEIEGFSDGSSSSDAFQTPRWQKSSTLGNSQTGAAGLSNLSSTSHKESEISESSSTAIASDPKLSCTAHTDPSSSTICPQSSDKTSLFKPHPLPGHQFSRQISEGRVPTFDSLNEEDRQSFSSTDLSAGESHGGSPDGWSMRSFSELILSSQRDSQMTTPSSSSFSSDLQTCGLCSKLLKERSSWKGNDISIAAVLVCGHVFHAECLETVTPEASKFDPSCPTCSHGESSAGKALVKACSKTRNKISRRAVTDIDVDENFILERQKSGSCILKDLRLGARSNGKRSFGRSFLRRHFSFGSQSLKSAPENDSSRKKGFWIRYRISAAPDMVSLCSPQVDQGQGLN